MGNCLQRSFVAGFRWCGMNIDVPNIQESADAEKLAFSYGLSYVSGKAVVKSKNDPVIVIYKDGFTNTNGEYHSVFASDGAPFCKWEVFAVITGWLKLRDEFNSCIQNKQGDTK